MAVKKGNIVVLDACTLIHLFCTDVQKQSMLRSLLKDQQIFIPDMVYNEAKKNADKLDDADQKLYVQGCLSQAHIWAERISDEEIRRDLSDQGMDELVTFTKHPHRDNGELFSVMLAAIKSREKQQYVHFFTDDYPAQDEFSSYYRLQQIGMIGDTADYLVYLYWMHSNFSKEDLLKRLQDLKAEYSLPFVNFLKKLKETIEVVPYRETKKGKLGLWVSNVEHGYYNGNQDELKQGLENLKTSDNKKIKDLATSVNSNTLESCAQVPRLASLINDIKRCDIWKIE